jgi:rhodanese-related sulfurtransferase
VIAREVPEIGDIQAQEDRAPQGRDRGVARLARNQGHFAEEVARTEAKGRRVRRPIDLDLALDDEIHAVALLAPPDHPAPRTELDRPHEARDGGEIAFLDVREIGRYHLGHPFLAVSVPLSRLELMIPGLIPRRSTRIVLADDGEEDGPAAAAAARLAKHGYSDIALLDGGVAAWGAARHDLHPEYEVVSKAFAAFARRHGGPAEIGPRELAAARAAGEDWLVVDARPRAEYGRATIPGSIDAAGPELLRVLADLAPSPETRIAVHCATRTRGILGALTLKAAGVPNPVHFLRDGVRAWRIAGMTPEADADRMAAPPSPEALAQARERAARLRAAAEVPMIDAETLGRWQGEAGRTTYLFDVRRAEEYESGHRPGARSAPEGNIVMSPDSFFATLGARIVLCDDDGVRASVTAVWLAQMGWGELAVLGRGLDGTELERGPEPREVLGLDEARGRVETIGPEALEALLAKGAAEVLDLARSDRFAAGHIPGAYWAIRAYLPGDLGGLAAGSTPLVLTSEDGALAMLAAAELAGRTDRRLLALEGGTEAWVARDLAMARGMENALSPVEDRWFLSDERPGDVNANMQAYIDWETGLYDATRRDHESRFRNLLWA